jgi:cysteinyl-tRNA synthetase
MVKDDAERQRCVERMKEYDVKALLHPKDMFRDGPYSKFDDDGIPTHDASGNEVGKSDRARLRKQWLQQKKNRL